MPLFAETRRELPQKDLRVAARQNRHPRRGVESLAYRLYEDEGKPDGRADEHWARAEQFSSRRTPRHRLFFGKIRYYPSGGLGLILVILLILLRRTSLSFAVFRGRVA
jgi:Protein of unknown function (DUF2934)/Protein of unknown function (DUF3309)